MTKQQKIKQLISDVVKISPDDILDEHRLLEDLDLYSTDEVSLIQRINKTFNTFLHPMIIHEGMQVRDLYSLV